MDKLFGPVAPPDPAKETMAEGAVLLRGAALPFVNEALAALSEIATVSPFRHMVTPGGFTMSVAMTNCGALGCPNLQPRALRSEGRSRTPLITRL